MSSVAEAYRPDPPSPMGVSFIFSREPLRFLTTARLCVKHAQEDKSNTFSLKRYQKSYHRFYIFSFAIYVRNMDMIDQVALHINKKNIESIKKLNLGL